jgi:hypothetical protein
MAFRSHGAPGLRYLDRDERVGVVDVLRDIEADHAFERPALRDNLPHGRQHFVEPLGLVSRLEALHDHGFSPSCSVPRVIVCLQTSAFLASDQAGAITAAILNLTCGAIID